LAKGPTSSNPDSIEGTIVAGKYQLIRLLGQGGMGAVYEARSTATLKRCAVKLLLAAEFARDPEVLERFFREAQASSIFESDHVVQVFDSGNDPQLGWPYMVMELLNGEDLEHTVERVGAVEPLAAAKLVTQAAMGLAKAHELGIVHRDIKPANLYVTRRETGDVIVKVLDFGIAKITQQSLEATSSGLTQTGSILGTPAYMSPEQVEGSRSIGTQSDVWSLGVVLFELLTGRLPWKNTQSLFNLMKSISSDELPLLQDFAPWVPLELAEVAHRALLRDPTQRYRNAGELRDALLRVIPDGPRILTASVQGVDPEQRGRVAPRLAARLLETRADEIPRATTRSGFTADARTGAEPTPQRSGKGRGLPLALGVVLLGGLGVGGYRVLSAKTEQGASTEPSAVAQPATIVPKPDTTTVPVTKHFELSIAPAEARASVDGAPTAIVEGNLAVSGAVGSAHQIELNYAGKSEVFSVTIAEGGLVPSRLELSAASASKSAPAAAKAVDRAVSVPRATTKPREPAAAPVTSPPAAKPALKKESELNRNVDEFGK